MAYTHVFQPLDLPHQQLKNRVIMGSMHTGLEDHFKHFDRLAAFYAQRAQAGVAAIITGGFSPNWQGCLKPFSASLNAAYKVKHHKKLTQAVHHFDCKLIMQILHSGRYGFHPFIVSASATQAPINRFSAKALSLNAIKRQIKAFIYCAQLAQQAQYDGIELMGSEGYFVNQFLSAATNLRDDAYGGSLQNRMRLLLEIIQGIRQQCGPTFIIIYRLSVAELTHNGLTMQEIIVIAQHCQHSGVDIINSGIGWHEARIPSIIGEVPKAAFFQFTDFIKQHIQIPICASNRINHPDIAEQLLAQKNCDLVSMARAFLADAKILQKCRQSTTPTINACIACNQACLDHVFANKRASCLVNPLACYELDYDIKALPEHFKGEPLAVVGAGPAGLASAYWAAKLGFQVELFEQQPQLGGQFMLAKKIPGKEDYQLTIDFFSQRLKQLNVHIHLNSTLNTNNAQRFKHIVLATGVTARVLPELTSDSRVLTYQQVLTHPNIEQLIPANSHVAILGAGGIGIDLCEYLLQPTQSVAQYPIDQQAIDRFQQHWGISLQNQEAGQLQSKPNKAKAALRKISLLQRSIAKIGVNLGKSSGWVHRKQLRDYKVQQLTGVEYQQLTPQGLIIKQAKKTQCIQADFFVLCIGQQENQQLWQQLKTGFKGQLYLVGGAKKAAGLDAKIAIKQAFETILNIKQQLLKTKQH